MKMIVIGCGRLGGALAEALSRRGDEVAVVDRDEAAFERLPPSFDGTRVVGAGFDREVLLRAGIERADALAALTASDEVNVVSARAARLLFKVPRVVARLYDPGKAEAYRRLGLPTISHVTWGVSRIVELLCYSPVEPVQSLGGGEVELVQVDLPPLLAGRSVRELALVGEILVVAVTREGRTLIPTPGTLFQHGDRVHLALLTSSSGRLKHLLGLP
ncbi:TrkA family potassium uptake protein [Geomonas sp. Red69]|uniref:TrkA family potassium uptake protein n=1 Tax=Geomonas diazotrophica TaxID=2843197 RepID=A0ABX8JLR2_9BACT|nr:MULTISPECIES: TrkA family potassium uptake protein [Geomonas]MBU5638725.1 TrkA family potassium uptake protein [Geomonas diazotrophica]QWV98698.1 TrkA family potassium uptake protein [Geomonas nitrogeniifigens]QXE87855.1 TrkA family potassium uptake protein [Geomonas nitrogeniifigens]